MDFFRLPLRFDELLHRKDLARCSHIHQSIEQFVQIILSTEKGEYFQDPDFGSGMWFHDFENIESANKWKEQTRRDLTELLQKYEPRLMNVVVETQISEGSPTRSRKDKTKQIKRLVVIRVTGRVSATNEAFQQEVRMFIGPFSLD